VALGGLAAEAELALGGLAAEAELALGGLAAEAELALGGLAAEAELALLTSPGGEGIEWRSWRSSESLRFGSRQPGVPANGRAALVRPKMG
jgi:hypothetical protein